MRILFRERTYAITMGGLELVFLRPTAVYISQTMQDRVTVTVERQ